MTTAAGADPGIPYVLLQGVVSVVVKVQAPADKPPALLRARVSSFLAGFRSHLEGLGQEQLQDFKASLVHKWVGRGGCWS
jgi:hypothetical protein